MRSLLVAAVALTPFALRADDPPKAKPVDVPVSKLGDKFRLVGKLGVELGEVVTVQGFVVDGPSKGYEGGPNLRVQRINGKATQQDIQIRLIPYFTDFGKEGVDGKDLPKLKNGTTYEMEGYETGRFVGIPGEAYKKAGIVLQTAGHHFLTYLTVYKVNAIDPIVWSPADFVDREALIEGKAVSRDKRAYIDGDGWKLLTDPVAAWPKEFEGKTVEGLGTVKKADSGEYKLEKGVTRLVRLEDQLGRSVELRGIAWSSPWHFVYRGTDLYVEDMEKLPGWKGMHGKPVVITGTLDEADMPDINWHNRDSNPPKKKYFIVRKAGWKPLDALLAPERAERK